MSDAAEGDRPLCVGGCGFFGSTETNGFCSVCFKKSGQAIAQASSGGVDAAPGSSGMDEESSAIIAVQQVEQPQLAAAAPSAELEVPEQVQQQAQETQQQKDEAQQPQKQAHQKSPDQQRNVEGADDTAERPMKKKRVQKDVTKCFLCRKNVGLLGFKCKCDYVFCGPHRHADEHDCPFDYKAEGQELLTKQNTRVTAEKLQRI